MGAFAPSWPPTCDELDTCVACDFRFFCPRLAASPDALAVAEAADEVDDVLAL